MHECKFSVAALAVPENLDVEQPLNARIENIYTKINSICESNNDGGGSRMCVVGLTRPQKAF
jgi:hypothetical protein